MIYEFAELIGRSRWLMDTSALQRLIASAESVTPDALTARLAALPQRMATPEIVGDVAVINITGPITYKESFFSMFFGSATVERIRAQFRTALADASVKGIVFRVDSPGGTVDAVPTLANEIFQARGTKPMVSISDTLNASAALWISSQADRMVVEPSSQTGSIGVLVAHEDISQMLEQMGVKITLIHAGDHKVAGNPYEPLDEETRERWQAEVDEVRDEFVAAVARGRRTSKSHVRESYGEGLMYSAKEAVKLGLADRIGTFEEALAMAPKARQGSARSAENVGQGGIVETPGLVMLGNDDPEMIVPLAKTPGGLTITVEGSLIHDEEVQDVIAQAVANATRTRRSSASEPEAAADPAAQIAADQDYTETAIKIAELL